MLAIFVRVLDEECTHLTSHGTVSTHQFLRYFGNLLMDNTAQLPTLFGCFLIVFG